MMVESEEDERTAKLTKSYVQLVYIVDLVVISRYGDFLKVGSFTIPILISLYTLISISVGNVNLNQNYNWNFFERFIQTYKLLPFEEISRLKIEINRCFIELKIIESLGKIPLNLSFSKLCRKKNEQFYIPKLEYDGY